MEKTKNFEEYLTGGDTVVGLTVLGRGTAASHKRTAGVSSRSMTALGGPSPYRL